MVTKITTCAECESILNESPSTHEKDRNPCPNCGSLSRVFKVNIKSTIKVQNTFKAKARHGETGKPFLEHTSGDSFFHRAQKWVYRIMRIDRDNDSYSELVIDTETNEVIHKCEEPLSKHRGHGSAKNKNA